LAFVGFFFDDVIPLEIAVADCESSVFLRRQLARQLGQAQADLQTPRYEHNARRRTSTYSCFATRGSGSSL
jgi:hypothetical protein